MADKKEARTYACPKCGSGADMSVEVPTICELDCDGKCWPSDRPFEIDDLADDTLAIECDACGHQWRLLEFVKPLPILVMTKEEENFNKKARLYGYLFQKKSAVTRDLGMYQLIDPSSGLIVHRTNDLSHFEAYIQQEPRFFI